MNPKINDGGPAFPVPSLAVDSGMTLRDYFAAAALQGLIASRGSMSTRFLAEDDASYVFEIADAMIKAREVKP